MPSAEYPLVESLLAQLLAEHQAVLGGNLRGLYLYGSLVWGDFDPQISDIDLMAAVATDLSPAEFEALRALHAAFARQHPEWDNRIEVAYISLEALRTFKTRRSPITVISPGEPLNTKDAGYDWLINWYIIQERGVTLLGPPPQQIIDSISLDEFRRAVQLQSQDWREWVNITRRSRPYQGYAILTLCRALYAVQTGEQPSKLQAARWVMARYPELAGQIQKALDWRANSHLPVDHPEATYPETERFVWRVADMIAALDHRP